MKPIAMAAALAALVMPAAVQAEESNAWNNFYIGVHGGYSWADTKSGGYRLYDHDYEDFSGGIQGGRDHRFPNNIVAGVMLDLGISNASGSRHTVVNAGGILITTQTRTELKSYGAVRGRLGYAMGDILPYGTLGIAWARHEVSYFQEFLPGFTTDVRTTESHIGWTAGAGIEYALTRSFSMKVEYLYTDYGSQAYRGSFWNLPVTERIDLTTHNTRLGLNYRF